MRTNTTKAKLAEQGCIGAIINRYARPGGAVWGVGYDCHDRL
jgi:hypothetical protein